MTNLCVVTATVEILGQRKVETRIIGVFDGGDLGSVEEFVDRRIKPMLPGTRLLLTKITKVEAGRAADWGHV